MATIAEPVESSGKPDLMRYGAAAAFLSIPVGSLYALVHHKRIPHFRLSARTVLFLRAELEGWLAGHAVELPKVVAQ